jgi:hypothetical protein
MPYLPGPLTLQDAANVGIVTKDYDFAGFTNDQLGDVGPTIDGMQAFFDDATLLLDEPEDPYPDLDLNGMHDVLGTYSDPVGILGIADILTSLGIAVVNLSGAVGAAPAEAWQDDPAPFVAPAAVQAIAVPEIPLGFLDVQVPGATGAPPPKLPAPPPSTPSGVILANLTRVGSGNFWVGDSYEITATGVPGARVTVQSTLNGQDLGSTYIGSIGDDGNFSTGGTEEPDAVGAWQQQWFVGPNNVAAYSFQVFSID